MPLLFSKPRFLTDGLKTKFSFSENEPCRDKELLGSWKNFECRSSANGSTIWKEKNSFPYTSVLIYPKNKILNFLVVKDLTICRKITIAILILKFYCCNH